MTREHPSIENLSAWLDSELDGDESVATKRHIEGCPSCRSEMAGWLETVRELEDPLVSERNATGACLDDETLAAYCEGGLSSDESASAEGHLGDCDYCVGRVQEALRIEIATTDAPTNPVKARELEPMLLSTAVHLARPSIARRVETWLKSLGEYFSAPLPAIGGLAAAALVLIVVVRTLPNAGDQGIRYRGIEVGSKVEVVVDTAECRARPDPTEPVLATLPRGASVPVLEVAELWVRVRIPDGRRVWITASSVAELDN